MPYFWAALAIMRVIGGRFSASMFSLGSRRKRAPSGIALGSVLLPSERCAGRENVFGLAHGMFSASACGITPDLSSLIIIVPVITGRLVAVAPHPMFDRPAHDAAT